MENRRNAFRIEYKIKDMPSVEIKNAYYPIIDISVTGMKFRKAAGFKEKQTIKGKINLHVDSIYFRGTIVRLNENIAAVNFYKEIDWGILIKERNYLKNKLNYRV